MIEGWKITKDHLNCGRVGYGQISVEDVLDDFNRIVGRSITVRSDLGGTSIAQPILFRLRDEDGEVHFHGVCSVGWLTGEDDLAYNIDRFGEADTGATISEFSANDLRKHGVDPDKIGCLDRDGTWTMVYG